VFEEVSMVAVSLALLAGAAAAAPAPTPDAIPQPEPAPAELLERLPVRMDADQEVEFDEPSEDVFGMGQRVIASSRVADNAFLLGQDLRVESPVDGDLFAAGETVRISAPVRGDVYGAASEILLEDRGSIGGNLYGAAGLIRIEGSVAGDLKAGAGRVILDAPIGGDVDLEVGELSIRDRAAVAGTLTYESPKPAANVDRLNASEVTFTLAEEDEDEEDDQPRVEAPPPLLSRLASFSVWTVWGYVSKLLVGFAFLAVGGRAAGRVARTLVDQPGRTLGLGFVVTCVVPVASILAMVLLLPLPLGVLSLIGLAVALYAGQVLTAQAIGDLVLKRLRPEALGSPYVSMAVGLIPLVLVSWIPWLGVIAWFAASVGGIGALWLATRRAATST
jgi:cytoskeletal protein CcmA (bactofilin family)